jgi:hypothetical protein
MDEKLITLASQIIHATGGGTKRVVETANVIEAFMNERALSDAETAALLNMIDHHLSGSSPDAAPSPEMAALTRARKKLEQAKEPK